MTAVLSGEADIGFMGSESSIYTYQEGANDVIKNFAQLTQETFWSHVKKCRIFHGMI